MSWKLKAILQNIFSLLPFGEKLNYFSQINITKNLPLKELQIQEKLLLAHKHIDSFQKYGQQPIEKTIFYEFGAGWDIVQPLLLYHLGINHQILVDIRKLIKMELVNDAIKVMQKSNIILCPQVELMQLIKNKDEFILSLQENLGIDYKAPLDARDTKLTEKIIDCITSTNTLEHIPAQDIKAILQECHRILKDDGIMSFQIDYQDHYSYFDNTISVYNFLKFSDYYWELFFNPSLHYQNRLRHKDYLEIINNAGFEILSEEILMSDLALVDLEKIKSIELHKKFSKYSLTELAVRGSHLVIRKRI
jgi:SAM-dependent methyltransferase